GTREREARRSHRTPEAPALLPNEQGPGAVRRGLQPDAIRSRKVRSFRAPGASQVSRDLSSLSDRADRRHVHRKADGGRTRCVRTVRQRRALRENARWNEGGTGARTLDVSRSPWLLERAAF